MWSYSCPNKYCWIFLVCEKGGTNMHRKSLRLSITSCRMSFVHKKIYSISLKFLKAICLLHWINKGGLNKWKNRDKIWEKESNEVKMFPIEERPPTAQETSPFLLWIKSTSPVGEKPPRCLLVWFIRNFEYHRIGYHPPIVHNLQVQHSPLLHFNLFQRDKIY